MTILIDLTLRSSVVILLGLMVRGLLHRNSAAMRHAVLAASMLGAATVVPLSLVGPSWDVPAPRATPSTRATVSTEIQQTVKIQTGDVGQTGPNALSQIALMLWGLGALLGAALLLAGLARLQVIARRAARPPDAEWMRTLNEICVARGIGRQVTICHTDAADLLATFGVIRPRVLLPSHASEWDTDRIRVVLSHELAHIERGDWVVQVGADLLRIVFWFNPLFWIACTRLRRDSERACDDVVLSEGVAPSDYAAHLLALARSCRRPWDLWAAATPMARPSTLERRFAAMLNPRIDRRPVSRAALALAAFLVAALTLPVASLHARQTSPATLSGSVYDPTGAVLPGVNVTVEDARQNRLQAVTDASGRFEFPSVAPGTYALQAELPGFRALRNDFELRTARDWDRAITLQVAAVREQINVRQPRTTAAKTPSATRTTSPVRIGGNIRVPRKVFHVAPVYPASMREAGREGVVPMEAVIGVDGAVHAIRVLSANIHPDFAVAAVDAVRQWRFDPTLLNGEPVEVTMAVTVAFSLSDEP